MKRRTFLAALLATAGCTGSPPTATTLAAGERGGLYFDFATLLNRLLPDVRPKETAGSLANLDLLRSGGADLALALADSVPGEDDLCALGRVYENYLQLLVRTDDPARTPADLAGRPVSLGASGSGASLSGRRLLAVLGVEVRERHLRLGEAADALVAGEVDALLWSGGVPTPRLAGLAAVRLLPLGDVVPALRAAHGMVYDRVTVPAGVYGAGGEVPTIGVANLVVCRRSLPGATVTTVVRTLLTRAASLVPEQTLGTQFLDARSLITTTPLPLHPDAAAAYRDFHG
ncbi:TAXI family TRAP transporter solute-binding subunit [Saccharothrix violaceirubra]|uniref:TRAP transporter TAXI family solute receptor n=1 Tax=Saccharothrix violaceirubra TaxID=413306 RepID=A0A7W7T1N2_9PSEU|nr:TAXI family TRAP transporter solute-binding subunit [Saccharothrix violaceirubra]MBB4964927.1 hypothetical protein [Saccharothrix violaceirubra]